MITHFPMAEDLNSDGSSDCPSKKKPAQKSLDLRSNISTPSPQPHFLWILQDASHDTSPPARQGVPAPAPDAELLEAENRRSRSCWTWEVGSCGGFFQKNVGFHIGNFHKSWRDLPKIVGFEPKKMGGRNLLIHPPTFLVQNFGWEGKKWRGKLKIL